MASLNICCLRLHNILTAVEKRKWPLLHSAGFGNSDHGLSHFETHHAVTGDSSRAVITGYTRSVRQLHVDWWRESHRQEATSTTDAPASDVLSDSWKTSIHPPQIQI